jgi:spore maturation protein CgeB
VKILFVSKCDYSGLTEGISRGFARLGHETRIFDLKKYRRIHKYLSKDFVGWRLERQLAMFSPDMVFVIAPLFVDWRVYQALDDSRSRRGFLTVGWIGDLFAETPENRIRLKFFDRLYYTDTGLGTMLQGLPSAYMPLATDPELFKRSRSGDVHGCVFIASWTDNREEFLSMRNFPISVWGPGWKKRRDKIPQHHVRGGTIPLPRTGRIYSQAKAALNLKNARNVINGLNQRSFDPCACKTVLLHDSVADLQLNFEPDKELLVFSTPEEFESLYDRIREDDALRLTIAEQGYRRVMTCHTYAHRARSIMTDLDCQGKVR